MATGDAAAPRRSKLPTQRVADSLAAELRQRILRNAYGDNASLPKQDQLVTEFGVSYPSVREALRILEAEGLITVRRGNVGGAEIRRGPMRPPPPTRSASPSKRNASTSRTSPRAFACSSRSAQDCAPSATIARR